MRQTQRSPEGPRRLHRIPRLSDRCPERTSCTGAVRPGVQHPPHSETSHLLGTSLETPRRDRPRWVLAQMAWGGQEHPVLLGRPGLRGGTSPWPTWGTALALPRRSALLLWSPSVVHVYVLVGVFSRGTTRISGSLSCGTREVRSPCAWRGEARPDSRVTGGQTGLPWSSPTA